MRVLSGERLETQLGDVRAIAPAGTIAAAICRDEEDGRFDQRVDEHRDVAFRRPVHPVQILECENDRTNATRGDSQALEDLERLPMNRVGTEVPDPLRPHADVQQAQHVRRRLVGWYPERRQSRPELAANDLDAVPVIDVMHTTDELDDRKQWHLTPVR